VIGAHRNRALQRAVESGTQVPLSFGLVSVFTLGGVALALATIALVVAQA